MCTVVDSILITYLRETPLEKRKSITKRILESNPERIPVLVARGECKNTPTIQRFKFLVSTDSTFGKFIRELRNHINNIEAYTSIVFFADNHIPTTHMLMQNVYDRYKNEDGFLYITYACENTFG